jgi:hypothetical protein
MVGPRSTPLNGAERPESARDAITVAAKFALS